MLINNYNANNVELIDYLLRRKKKNKKNNSSKNDNLF